MRILLVTVSELLLPTFQKVLSFENDYCAIVVDDPDSVKKILVPAGCPEKLFFSLYDLKECVENLHYDVVLCVTDPRVLELTDYCFKQGVPKNKFLHLNLFALHLNFLVDRALRYYKEHAGEFEMFATGDSRTETGLDTNQFKRKLFNLGRASQDLYYDYKTAKFVFSLTGGKKKLNTLSTV